MKHRKFHYKPRGTKSVKKRASRRGGGYDSLFKDFPEFRPEAGDHRVRILPPTFEKAEHYGLDMSIHYGIGPDEGAYLCTQVMQGKPCPVCDERKRAARQGDDDYAGTLRAGSGVAVWVIVRGNEDTGPQLWRIPFKLDREIAKQSIQKETGKALMIDHPEKGYDVFFTREGTKKENTSYTGVSVARHPSPICDDKKTARHWLEFIGENPLDECMNYFEYDYIKDIFAGTKERKDDDEDEGEPDGEDDDNVKGARGKRRRRPEPDEDDEDDDAEDASDDEDESEDEDDEDDEPKTKRRRLKSRRVEPDEDDEDEPDEDDEPKAKRRRLKSEPDEDDEDDEDEDASDDEDESEDEDDDEEPDEDEPDEDDEEPDEDDAEDDGPKTKKTKKGKSTRQRIHKGLKG